MLIAKATALNHIGARDENVTLTDYSNNQMLVPNFRQSLLSPLKKTLWGPDDGKGGECSAKVRGSGFKHKNQ